MSFSIEIKPSSKGSQSVKIVLQNIYYKFSIPIMGDPFSNLFTVSSTTIEDSSHNQHSSPIFLASSSPTTPSIIHSNSPLPSFATALTISASPKSSDHSILSKNKLKHDFGIVFSKFDAAVTNLGYLMEVTYSQGRPLYATDNLLKTVCHGIAQIIYLYQPL
ncbi:hypothetical protein O181_121719 [Austropuccinia psidii MF-1]|uniref:Uncharacterized protein n=1 Tax=Austropuccinia psidii MF-1 TaxID=1389203 RepID=A0A9Q3Q1M8_9BASI|nr:hypothetical protein [Austropuccinia psidii MF-1]